MSKLAKKPILIPEGIEVAKKDGILEFKSKTGALKVKILNFTEVEISDRQLSIKGLQTHKQAKANLGTMASLIKNALAGVQNGFTKVLELEGIGFRASMEGNTLTLSLGFSHPIKFVPPADVKITLEKNQIKVSGADKALVGQVAADIRKIKKPEPYKGTGIRYQGEVIRRKAGKKVVAAAGA